jgi:Putative transposase/Transposase zinc-binding domain
MSCRSGPAPELTVAQVLKVFLPEYLDRHSVPAHHLKVLRRLTLCRSGQLGWTVWQCQQCHHSHWRPHGCGDRHCPACQHQRSREWLERQRGSLLPVRYFHWVFTLPATLRPLVLQNPAALYQALFESASATLLQFGQERFAAELGLTAILHTWGQNLMDHPHLHCLVTGGGLTAQNTWAGPKQTRWLFPVHAVAQMFQGKFCAALLQLHTTGKLQFLGELQHLQAPAAFAALLRQVRSRRWVLFAKGSVVGPDHVLDYLGRYTHRVALSNSRLRALDPAARTVTFTYKDYADGSRTKPLALTGIEFIRRFLLHLLPPGFTKIRHYGLLGNNRRHQRIPLARTALETSPLRFQPQPPQPPAAPTATPLLCPHCQGPQLRCIGRADRWGKVTLFTRALLLAAVPLYADSS